MATSASAHVHMILEAEGVPASPVTGALKALGEVETRWTQGTGSGNVDRIYMRERSALGAGATDSYNLLAAGSLEDIHGQAIDADELKALYLIPTSGSIRLEAPAATILPIFNDATDVLNVPSFGLMFNWGAAGLTIGTDGSFDVTETTGAATADYTLVFICAQ